MMTYEEIFASMSNGEKKDFSPVDDRWTTLHWAAWNGRKEVAEFLLSQGAKVNARDEHGHTPLHCAAMWNKKDIVELLIEHGADVNATDNEGRTPLHYAAWDDHIEVVEMLRNCGAMTASPASHKE
jgi:ankyrin repeat protein